MKFEYFLPQSTTEKSIYLKLTDTLYNKSYILRTPLRINAESWDQEMQRPVNIYLKKYKKLNNKLNAIKKELAEYIQSKHSQRKQPPRREMSKKIKEICFNDMIPLFENSLLYYMQQYIDIKKEQICHSTYKRYKVFFHLLERFEGNICKKLHIEKVDTDFMKKFMKFGREEQYRENTILRTIHFVKTILSFAERKGVHTRIRELEIRSEKQHTEVVTLTEKEILQIKNTSVPKDLQSAKDWLLISCYTGQRFSDFMHFNIKKIKEINGKKCIAFIQQKTKKNIILPLHPVVLSIIRRDGYNFPCLMSIERYNDHIKQIARLADLKESVCARKRIGYRTRDVQAEKWEILSSHIGRRSFATNFYGRIPTPLLMLATGHSTEQVFLKYINPMDESRILSLGNYFENIYEEYST